VVAVEAEVDIQAQMQQQMMMQQFERQRQMMMRHQQQMAGGETPGVCGPQASVPVPKPAAHVEPPKREKNLLFTFDKGTGEVKVSDVASPDVGETIPSL